MFEDFFASLVATSPRSPKLLPGLKLANAVRWGIVAIPLLMAIVFPLFILATSLSDPHMRLSMGHPIHTGGRVLSVAKSGNCGNASVEVTFVFDTPDGQEYRGVDRQCANTPYADARIGDVVPVIYLANSPEINAIAGHQGDAPPMFVFVFFPLFFLIMFSPLYVPQIRTHLQARRLFATGILTKAELIYVRSSPSSISWPGFPGAQGFNFFVRFRDLAGNDQEAKLRCDNIWLVHHCAPGAVIHIAYNGNDPQRAILLDNYVR